MERRLKPSFTALGPFCCLAILRTHWQGIGLDFAASRVFEPMQSIDYDSLNRIGQGPSPDSDPLISVSNVP